MKWLKRSLRYLPDEFGQAAWRDYRANLQAVGPRLPASVMRLATEFSLHDAKVERLRLTGACSTDVTLITGDSDRGYVELRLGYEESFPWGAKLSTIHDWLMDSRTVVDTDEVDFEHGQCQHRFLLWPEGEFYLSFTDLDLEVNPVVPDRYQPHAAATSVTFAEPPKPVPLLRQYTKVRLRTESYANDGVQIGDIGWILEIYGPGLESTVYAPCWGYELEFMTATGHTLALLGVRCHEVESAE